MEKYNFEGHSYNVFEVDTPWGDRERLFFVPDQYSDNRSLAVLAYSIGEDGPERFDTLTVNLHDPHQVKKGYAFFDINNSSYLYDFLKEKGIVTPSEDGYRCQSSFCEYPLVKFDLDALVEGREENQKYFVDYCRYCGDHSYGDLGWHFDQMEYTESPSVEAAAKLADEYIRESCEGEGITLQAFNPKLGVPCFEVCDAEGNYCGYRALGCSREVAEVMGLEGNSFLGTDRKIDLENPKAGDYVLLGSPYVFETSTGSSKMSGMSHERSDHNLVGFYLPAKHGDEVTCNVFLSRCDVCDGKDYNYRVIDDDLVGHKFSFREFSRMLKSFDMDPGTRAMLKDYLKGLKFEDMSSIVCIVSDGDLFERHLNGLFDLMNLYPGFSPSSVGDFLMHNSPGSIRDVSGEVSRWVDDNAERFRVSHPDGGRFVLDRGVRVDSLRPVFDDDADGFGLSGYNDERVVAFTLGADGRFEFELSTAYGMDGDGPSSSFRVGLDRLKEIVGRSFVAGVNPYDVFRRVFEGADRSFKCEGGFGLLEACVGEDGRCNGKVLEYVNTLPLDTVFPVKNPLHDNCLLDLYCPNGRVFGRDRFFGVVRGGFSGGDVSYKFFYDARRFDVPSLVRNGRISAGDLLDRVYGLVFSPENVARLAPSYEAAGCRAPSFGMDCSWNDVIRRERASERYSRYSSPVVKKDCSVKVK